jgi:hypothetical protein
MSKKQSESNRPTGANLKFDSIPLNGRVVVREITEQDNASGEYNAAAGEGGAQ